MHRPRKPDRITQYGLEAIAVGVLQGHRTPHGGRGFSFTSAHFHRNCEADNFRKTVLNAIVWTAKLEVPAEGVVTKTPTDEEMKANLDEKKK